MTDDAPKPTEPGPETPPWGENFDAASAWTLIQNLRGDKASLQTKVDGLTGELTTERQAREAAETALQNPDPEGKIAAAENRAKEAERGLYREKALRKFPALEALGDNAADFLTGEDEAAILTKAELLASLGGKSTPKTEDPKPANSPETPAEPEPTPPGHPTPALTPGHGGTAPQPKDLDAIARSGRAAQKSF